MAARRNGHSRHPARKSIRPTNASSGSTVHLSEPTHLHPHPRSRRATATTTDAHPHQFLVLMIPGPPSKIRHYQGQSLSWMITTTTCTGSTGHSQRTVSPPFGKAATQVNILLASGLVLCSSMFTPDPLNTSHIGRKQYPVSCLSYGMFNSSHWMSDPWKSHGTQAFLPFQKKLSALKI